MYAIQQLVGLTGKAALVVDGSHRNGVQTAKVLTEWCASKALAMRGFPSGVARHGLENFGAENAGQILAIDGGVSAVH